MTGPFFLPAPTPNDVRRVPKKRRRRLMRGQAPGNAEEEWSSRVVLRAAASSTESKSLITPRLPGTGGSGLELEITDQHLNL